MRNDKLSVQSMDFAVQIINLVKSLKETRESIISNQIGRSGTSIGANIREAQYAHGKADFVAKLQIALKECYETEYWLRLLNRTKYITDSEFSSIFAENQSVTNILAKIVINGVTSKVSVLTPARAITGSGNLSLKVFVIPHKKLVKNVRTIPAIIIRTKKPHFLATPL